MPRIYHAMLRRCAGAKADNSDGHCIWVSRSDGAGNAQSDTDFGKNQEDSRENLSDVGDARYQISHSIDPFGIRQGFIIKELRSDQLYRAAYTCCDRDADLRGRKQRRKSHPLLRHIPRLLLNGGLCSRILYLQGELRRRRPRKQYHGGILVSSARCISRRLTPACAGE